MAPGDTRGQAGGLARTQPGQGGEGGGLAPLAELAPGRRDRESGGTR